MDQRLEGSHLLRTKLTQGNIYKTSEIDRSRSFEFIVCSMDRKISTEEVRE